MLILFVALIYVCALGWNYRQARTVEETWLTIRDLRVGPSLSAQAKEHLSSPWICESNADGETCHFGMINFPSPASALWRSGIVRQSYRIVGLHAWLTQGSIHVDKRGVLTKRYFQVIIAELSNPYSETGLSFSDGDHDPTARCDAIVLRHPQYSVYRPYKNSGLVIRLGPLASEESRQRASDIHLSCLERAGACNITQLAPSAWIDHEADDHWISENKNTIEEFLRSCTR